MRPRFEDVGLDGNKMSDKDPLLGPLHSEVFKHVAGHLDLELVLLLPFISKSFYKFCFDGWLVSYLAWGSQERRVGPITLGDLLLWKSKIVAHRVQHLPKGLSIVVFSEESNLQVTLDNAVSMIIRYQDSEGQSDRKHSSRNFIIDFFSNSFRNLKYLFLDSVLLNFAMMSTFSKFDLERLHLHNCSIEGDQFRKILSFTTTTLKMLYITMRETLSLILIPAYIEELYIRHSGRDSSENSRDADLCVTINVERCNNLKHL